MSCLRKLPITQLRETGRKERTIREDQHKSILYWDIRTPDRSYGAPRTTSATETNIYTSASLERECKLHQFNPENISWKSSHTCLITAAIHSFTQMYESFSSVSRNTEPSDHNPQMAKLVRKLRAENTDRIFPHINGIPQIVSNVTAFRVRLCQLRVLGKGNNKWITIIKVPVLCHDQPILLTLKINFIDTTMQLYSPTADFSVRPSGLVYGAVVPQNTRCRC